MIKSYIRNINEVHMRCSHKKARGRVTPHPHNDGSMYDAIVPLITAFVYLFEQRYVTKLLNAMSLY